MAGIFDTVLLACAPRHLLPPLYQPHCIFITLLVLFQPVSFSAKFCEGGNHVLPDMIVALSPCPGPVAATEEMLGGVSADH